VNEDSKAKEHPVVFTEEIHKIPSLSEVVVESMGEIVDFVAQFKESHNERYESLYNACLPLSAYGIKKRSCVNLNARFKRKKRC
jgi:hypothetical protein